jgi:hypothetical protein
MITYSIYSSYSMLHEVLNNEKTLVFERLFFYLMSQAGASPDFSYSSGLFSACQPAHSPMSSALPQLPTPPKTILSLATLQLPIVTSVSPDKKGEDFS